ncbi:MAG: hypothetical protein XU15_C0009G0004 [candidate division NC10 bacterium CSP1-5]|nr:MAG: hypothetical protein XU15_C0009G0004 [candidate division NC10 bacterium CSP1-5]
MTDENAKIPEPVLGALRGSGFPFQTAVAHVIRGSPGWSVHASEYPWQGPGNDSQFLDLIATDKNLFLTIECKKTRKDIFTFLRPVGHSHTGQLEDFRCLRAEQIQNSTRRVEIFCEDWGVYPRSTHAEFCIVSTSESGKDQRLLEKDAGLLIHATEAFAEDFRDRFQSRSKLSPTCLFLPVIVTNAPIYTARYDPTSVSLETGEFSELPQEIESAPCVRFRKAFISGGARELGERSVFVVNAASLSEFLGLVRTAPHQPAERAQVHFQQRLRR